MGSIYLVKSEQVLDSGLISSLRFQHTPWIGFHPSDGLEHLHPPWLNSPPVLRLVLKVRIRLSPDGSRKWLQGRTRRRRKRRMSTASRAPSPKAWGLNILTFPATEMVA